MSACCAAGFRRHEDHDDLEHLKGNFDNGSGLNIVYDQPRPIDIPFVKIDHVPARPSTSHSAFSGWINSSRMSISLSRPLTAKPKLRPSISAPRDFRHIQAMSDMPLTPPVPRRRSFRPLNLSIHLPEGRLSPLPNFDAWSTDAGLQFPEQARVRSMSASECDEVSSNFTIQRKPLAKRVSSITVDTLAILSPFLDKEVPPIPPRSPDRSAHVPHEVSVPRPVSMRAASPGHSAMSSEHSLYMQRQMSYRRDRKPDVDQEIRELKIIVEETRRAEKAARSGAMTPESGGLTEHRPAIAPAMVVRARTETLSDIGSAFSTPLAHVKPLPTPEYSPSLPSSKQSSTLLAHEHPNMHAFRFPSPSHTPSFPPQKGPNARSRVTDWLRSRSTKPSNPGTPATPFYQCQPPSATMADRHASYTSETSTIVSDVPSFSYTDESPLSQASSPPTVTSVSPAMSPLPVTPGTLTKSRSMQSLSSMRWNNYQRVRGMSVSSRTSTGMPLTSHLVKEEEDWESRRYAAVGVAY